MEFFICLFFNQVVSTEIKNLYLKGDLLKIGSSTYKKLLQITHVLILHR